MRSLSPLVVAALLLAACGGDTSPDPSDALSDVADVLDAATDSPVVPDAAPDVVDVGPTGCTETAGATLPDDVEWIVLDGQSTDLISLADRPLNAALEGQFGTYDLNALAFAGANGFYLEEPMRVLGAQARFTNLEEMALPASLTIWPDFSSDGYVFDVENPIATYSRCLSTEDDGEWVTFAFETPIEMTQPLHIFVGTERGEVAEVDGGWDYSEPELLFENFQQEAEPYFSGIRWPDFDEEQFYLGQASPWFTWQVRIAVERTGTIAEADKPFGPSGDFDAGRRYAWGDYDNDGDDDLMIGGPALWENEGGTFTNVSETAFLEALPGTGGGVWGDYDNDGCLDYFGQARADLLLHSNCDGTFTDVTADAGISDVQETRDCDGDGEPEASPTEGAAWFDYDGDGFLDLYVANYECSSEFDYFQNYRDRLFRNLGDGTFEDTTEEFTIDDALHAGRGVSAADVDGDRDVDLFVSNYRLDPNFLFINDGGELTEEARLRGVQGVNVSGAYGHTIGSAFGDIDNDGDLDLVQANLAHPFYYQFSDLSAVLINDGFGQFVDEAAQRGIYYRETHSNPTLFDADTDGDLDLFVTCVYPDRDSDFYENDGDGYFTLRNYESGLIVNNGWGSAASDFDNDGDVDVVAGRIFENRGTPDGNWLQVRALGTGDVNWAALGATVEVDAGGATQTRFVSGGSGTGCQDSMYLSFGLGDATSIDEVRVRFPYGDTVTVRGVEPNGRLWVWSDGESATGWDWPER